MSQRSTPRHGNRATAALNKPGELRGSPGEPRIRCRAGAEGEAAVREVAVLPTSGLTPPAELLVLPGRDVFCARVCLTCPVWDVLPHLVLPD